VWTTGALLVAAAVAAGSGTAVGAAALAGIPRDLARERAAQISEVRYHLKFTLIPHADAVAGAEELTFALQTVQPVLLDFRDGTIGAFSVNGAAVDPRIENGHVIIPAKDLRAGQNAVEVQFTSHVAPAGKPITRYEDRDDNSEYIYTLFVPMDASMAFPCFDQPDLKARFQLELIAPANWTVISNTAPETESNEASAQRWTLFHETLPSARICLPSPPDPFAA
jgi:aminopeptidase N